MVDGINSQMQSIGQSALAALSSSAGANTNNTSTASSSTSSTNTAAIESEIKSSGNSYTAQELADKYGISLADAQKILNDVSKNDSSKKTDSSQNTKSDIPDSPQLEPSERPSTVTYRV